MGAIWTNRRELTSIFGDALGYKSGLVLSYEQILDLLDNESYRAYWTIDEDSAVRIRSEVIDDMFAGMLHRLGLSRHADNTPHMIRLFKKYYNTEEQPLYEAVSTLWLKFLHFEIDARKQSKNEQPKNIDPRPIIEECRKNFGPEGMRIVIEIMEELNEDLARSFWGKIRKVEWKNTRDLDELFKSEKLESLHGRFFDQRFINYLSSKFDKIDDIHWRQFEGLTCEFFERQGFVVAIGEGRGDGGIDARVWHEGADKGTPPAILVQCKRQKDKIGKMVVKSLYADILDEQAASGLIVTSSELQPGAEAVCRARAYPIDQAKRQNIREWVLNMRTPHNGIFMSA